MKRRPSDQPSVRLRNLRCDRTCDRTAAPLVAGGNNGTLAERDRIGDGRADYSHKHRRHGVNVQVVTDPAGRLRWLSPALPGRAHDLTAAHTHRIIRICERQGVPALADRAYLGAGPWATTPVRRPPGRGFRRPSARSTARSPRRGHRWSGVWPSEVLAHLPQSCWGSTSVHPLRPHDTAAAGRGRPLDNMRIHTGN
jgi:hypothetical protein